MPAEVVCDTAETAFFRDSICIADTQEEPIVTVSTSPVVLLWDDLCEYADTPVSEPEFRAHSEYTFRERVGNFIEDMSWKEYAALALVVIILSGYLMTILLGIMIKH